MKAQDRCLHLQKVLGEFSRNYLVKRENAFRGLDFEKLRTELAAVKDRSLDRLGEDLARFEELARAHGSRVLRARDGDEANRLIGDILSAHGVKKLVKSKSMVSEETRLNEFLARCGIEPRETDLGEWIVQLGGEGPSHMVMPAIHLTREDVARIFSGHLGWEVPDDIPGLIRLAREELRREIFEAGAGLTGANALVAENGAVMLVTNEGNGRLVSTVPPVHIVLATIEKVLPATRDALLLLKVLTRNATGQDITSYVSFIVGPHREAQYIILLDNHRSEILEEAAFREVLRCIKCSACLNVCPVYQVVGGGKFSHIYMGGIGSLLTAWIHGLRESRRLADFCLGCHRCEEVCSTKINIADLVAGLKERLHRNLGSPLWKRMAFAGVMGKPTLLRRMFSLGRGLQPVLGGRKGFSRRLPPGLRKYDRFRALPAPSKKSFSQMLKHGLRQKKGKGKRGPVTIFAGCLVENFYPGIGLAAAEVLQGLGYEVQAGPAVCCGFPPTNSGFSPAAKKTFSKLLTHFTEEDVVITLCPTCATMLTHLGPQLVGTDEAKSLSRRVFTFSQFLMDREDERVRTLFTGHRFNRSVAYHDSCHHKFFLKASGASRRLLRLSLNREILELDRDTCCGFGGGFSVSHPEVSESLLQEKISAIRDSGAEVVALDCPGCLLQVRGGLRRAGLGIEVLHSSELAASRLRKT